MPKRDGLEKGYWRTARGQVLRICRMDDTHLLSTERWLRRALESTKVDLRIQCQNWEDAEAFGFWDDDQGSPLSLGLLLSLAREQLLTDKLKEMTAEIQRRKGIVYRMTHRKRPGPEAIMLTERRVQIRF